MYNVLTLYLHGYSMKYRYLYTIYVQKVRSGRKEICMITKTYSRIDKVKQKNKRSSIYIIEIKYINIVFIILEDRPIKYGSKYMVTLDRRKHMYASIALFSHEIPQYAIETIETIPSASHHRPYACNFTKNYTAL